jgi:secreted trypsin-like serine protease
MGPLQQALSVLLVGLVALLALAGEARAADGKVVDAAPSTRIVGGEFAFSSEYPWQVALVVSSEGEEFLCGGSLIHPLIVITAAHCLIDEAGEAYPELSALVLLGETVLGSGGEAREAAAFLAHPEYDPASHPLAPEANDVGFVVLDEATGLPRIQIAGADERALWTVGRDAYVTGWGQASETGPSSVQLKQALVPIVDDAECGSPGVYGSAFLESVMVCAGYLAGGVDSCFGDSGGPLQSPIDGGGFRLTGIVSWGEGCARPLRPGVYTRVADAPLREFVASSVPFIEQKFEFPPEYRGIAVIGSGARPPGCAAAEAALAAAQETAAGAKRTLNRRQAALRRALKSLRKRRAAVARARRQARGRPAARPRLRAEIRRARRAAARFRGQKRRRNAARAQLFRERSALGGADAEKLAVCGG